MNKRIRLLISVLFIIAIGLAVAVTRFNSKGTAGKINNNLSPDIKSITSKNFENYYVFKSNNNLFGVIDDNEKVIIEPAWNNIDFINKEKMIVSKTINNDINFGIIDNQDNVIVPFIYSKFENVNNNLMLGYISDTNKIVLFNKNGKMYINDEWDECSVSDSFVYLTKDLNQYTAQISNEQFNLIKITLYKNISGMDFSIIIYGDKYNINSNYNIFDKFISDSINYIESEFNNEDSMNKKINDQVLGNYTIDNLLSTNIDVQNDVDLKTNYYFNLKADCIMKSDVNLPVAEQKRCCFLFKVCMIKNQDGDLVLKNINVDQV